MTMKAGTYFRSATGDPRQFEEQERECAELALQHDLDVVANFRDGGSGTTGDRPGLKALLEAVRKREVDVVLVADLARLSRSSLVLAEILALCERTGTRVLATDIDARLPLGFISGLAAAMESTKRREHSARVRRGMEARKARMAAQGQAGNSGDGT
jgi:DNA invertase Pin-like site-specific DNA recombinase